MARFSERYGYREVRTALQQEEMDLHLRTDLWNAVHAMTDDAPDYTRHFPSYLQIWIHLWHEPLDRLPHQTHQMSERVKTFIFGAEWYDVYDLIETYVQGFDEWVRPGKIKLFNHMLEKNLSAYRFVDDVIAKIDEDSDVEAIEQALRDSADVTGAKRHLQQALHLLSDRDTPDYPNSIKESISAVESACQHITGNRKATLGDGIKTLKDKGVSIHPALERSWLAAYGYTSDADGIRHALESETTVDQARARYFLVTCSAFVSLLLTEAANVGLLEARDA